MSALPEITVDATTGATISIASSNTREEALLRCRGGRVWVGFNEVAVANQGIWLDNGDAVVIARPLCQADMYFVTAGVTAYIGAETVFG